MECSSVSSQIADLALFVTSSHTNLCALYTCTVHMLNSRATSFSMASSQTLRRRDKLLDKTCRPERERESESCTVSKADPFVSPG